MKFLFASRNLSSLNEHHLGLPSLLVSMQTVMESFPTLSRMTGTVQPPTSRFHSAARAKNGGGCSSLSPSRTFERCRSHPIHILLHKIIIAPHCLFHILLKYRKVARPGIEPRTFWTYTRCSNQLSYPALEFNQLILYLCNCQPKDAYSARHI
jgi:hypothetical protein